MYKVRPGLIMDKHGIRAISRLLSIPASTVSYIARKWRTHGSIRNMQRSGRPSVITDRGLRHLKNIVKANRRETLQWITNNFNLTSDVPISTKTIIRRLHRLGFRARTACKKPLVTARDRRKRLAYYHKHKTWTITAMEKCYILRCTI